MNSTEFPRHPGSGVWYGFQPRAGAIDGGAVRLENYRDIVAGAYREAIVFDVIIAYFNDTWWLVHGVAHLDAMLSDKASPDLRIEIVTCDAWTNVVRLWDEPEEGKLPWAINPRVIERLKLRENTSSS